MATVRGVLGQSAPSATSLTDLYTVPAAKNATGRVIVTNRGGTDTTFRVSVAIGGAADDNSQYLVYGKAINGNDAGSTIAFMVGATDVIRVFAGNANLSFTFTGVEQDN
jgi:hypothetical protein